MSLSKPPLATVTPGEPVTAQGWNALVNGLSALYDAVIALGSGVLEVAVTSAGKPVTATVLAEPFGEGQPTAALPPYGTRTTHLLVGLTGGLWRVHVQSSGFVTETRDITVPTKAGPIAVPLTPAGVRVPDLFGVGALAALNKLRAAGIDADLLLDTTGQEISRTAVPPEYVDSPVLAQLPATGEVLPAGTGRVRLVVASALRRDPVVTMPSLVGLSLTEAKEVLEKVGLTLGSGKVHG
jgi:hypothetical protein